MSAEDNELKDSELLTRGRLRHIKSLMDSDEIRSEPVGCLSQRLSYAIQVLKNTNPKAGQFVMLPFHPDELKYL